jgi:hypothetical protein
MEQHQTLFREGVETGHTFREVRFHHPVEKITPPIYIENQKERVTVSARLMEFAFTDHARVVKVFIMSIVLITALYTKSYEGLYYQFIHDHIGGVLYVLFGSLFVSLFFPRLHLGWSTGIAFAGTCALEFVQWLQLPFMAKLTQYKAMAYLFGTSYNAEDFIYYVVGGLLSLFVLWLIREEQIKLDTGGVY